MSITKMALAARRLRFRMRSGSIYGGVPLHCPIPIKDVTYDEMRLGGHALTSPRCCVEDGLLCFPAGIDFLLPHMYYHYYHFVCFNKLVILYHAMVSLSLPSEPIPSTTPYSYESSRCLGGCQYWVHSLCVFSSHPWKDKGCGWVIAKCLFLLTIW